MLDRLVLTPAVREELFAQAREGAPEEICGILAGDSPGNGGRSDDERERACVTAVHQVSNVADEPRFRYDLDPAETVERIEAVEDEGLAYVGFYHSHPEGPRGPSRTDEARATWPGYVYLIVSLGEDPVIGAWRWTGERFVQVPIEVDDRD